MKQVQQITLGGVVFSIEADAYTQLSEYLQSVEKHFMKTMSDDAEEVLADIEAGIAEKVIVRGRNTERAITQRDVRAVIEELGTVGEMSDEDAEAFGNDTNTKTSGTHHAQQKRRLYRDTDDVVLAGVASGIAKYFDIDVVWVRVAFLIALFMTGFGFWVYIILWIAVPKALTTSQKMAMQGESINLDSVKTFVREKIDEVPRDAVEKTQGFFSKYLFKRGKKDGVDTLYAAGGVVENIFIIIRKCVGIIFMVASGIVMFVSTLMLMAAAQAGLVFEMDAMTQRVVGDVFTGSTGLWQGIALYFIVMIPSWFIFMLGRWLVCLKTRIPVIVSIVFGMVWMIAFSTLLVFTLTQVSRLGAYAEDIEQMYIDGNTGSFYLKMTDRDDGKEVFNMHINPEGILIRAGEDEVYRGNMINEDSKILVIPSVSTKVLNNNL